MNKTSVTCLLSAILVLPVVTQAQETNCFKTSFNLGVTIADGNSVTRQANAALLTEAEKPGLGALRAGAELNYGESTVKGEKDTTLNNAKIFGEVKKTLHKSVFGYLNASVLHDDMAKVGYRATIGPGLGVDLVKNDKTFLSVEAGASYIWEKVTGATDNALAIRFAERLERALSDSAKAWQSAEFLPKADDFGNYLLGAEMGVEAAMNTRMSLRVVLQDKYDSTPGDGMKDNDLALIAGVSVKL